MHTWTFDMADAQSALSTSTPLPQRLDSCIYLAGFARQQMLPGPTPPPPSTKMSGPNTASIGQIELEKMTKRDASQDLSATNWPAVLAYLLQVIGQLVPLIGS